MKTRPEGTDEELLLALASGDDSALTSLYRRYVPMVFRMAAQSLGRDTAEDIVQEVFASVWKIAATFDPARDFGTRGWQRISDRPAVNRMACALTKVRRYDETLPSSPSVQRARR